MKESAETIEDEGLALDRLFAAGERAPAIQEKVDLMQLMRRSRDRGRRVDVALLERIEQLTSGLGEARSKLGALEELMAKMLAPPWHPGTLVRLVGEAEEQRAVVVHGGAARVVCLAPGVDPVSLTAGDEVLLSRELNLVVGRSPHGAPPCGEVALFQRRLANGRLVLRSRDEEVVVESAGALGGAALAAGDPIRWDRQSYVAFERLERDEGRRYLLSELPEVTRAAIGGCNGALDLLLSALSARLVAPEKAARYGLGGRQSVLLYGPPGCGKTLMARIAAAEISRLGERRCRIAVVKPAEWESPWVGETQSNIRACFAALRREAEEDGQAILFLDEVEAVGRIRGNSVGFHSDKFLAAFLAELDGFDGRGNLAVIAATNRKDLVDPALLERLSDVEIAVGRPDMRAAREIIAIHLPPSIPYADDGATAAEAREAIIDTAVSRFYSPRGDNELCSVRLRDGTARTVAARELASGRTFEQVCRAARRNAFLRELRQGRSGLTTADVEAAAAGAMERLASTLSPRNAHAYLADLPQDVDVVSVEPIRRRVSRPDRYLAAGPNLGAEFGT